MARLKEEEQRAALPENFTFEQINYFVHDPNVFFEDLQAVCLDMANHIDRMRSVCFIATNWMEFWLDQNLCDCTGEHICGRPERQEELRQLREMISGEWRNPEVSKKEKSQ